MIKNIENYLKYSHLPTIREYDDLPIETENKSTQYPDIQNKSIQTNIKTMEDKETDTGDVLHKIDYPYILKMSSNNFESEELSRADKMAQVFAKMIEPKQRRRGSRSSSSSSSSSGYLGKGLRLAEMSGHAMLSGLNLASNTFNFATDLADYIAEAITQTQQEESEEEEQEQEPEQASVSNQIPNRRSRSRSHDSNDNDYNPPSSSNQNPFRRGRSRSRDDIEYEPDDDLVNRLLRRGASRSRSSSRDGGYPKKKK